MKKKKGLYANILAKRKRIEKGSGEKMKKVGDKGAPTASNFKAARVTAKKIKKKNKNIFNRNNLFFDCYIFLS